MTPTVLPRERDETGAGLTAARSEHVERRHRPGLAANHFGGPSRTGRRLVLARIEKETMPFADFLASCEETPEARVSGTAVFPSTHTQHVPLPLRQNLKQNKVLHRTVLLVRVTTDNIPRVAGPDRVKAQELGQGFWQIDAHFDSPGPERAAGARAQKSQGSASISAKFFLCGLSQRQVDIAARDGPMARESLYLLHSDRYAADRFVRIPSDQVVELGAEVEI